MSSNMMPSRTALALRLLWLACLALVTATLLSAAPADAREIIIEDVSNPGRDDVVPTVAREEDEAVPTMSEEEDDEEMREEVEWNPFLYRRLQDLPGSAKPVALANWMRPPNASGPDAWKKDMEEVMSLLETVVEREEGTSIEAQVGADGQVLETSTFVDVMNALSKSPSKLFPMCSPVGIVSRVRLLCPMVTISARILIRGPPDFEQLAHEHHCPNPGYRLPEPLEDLSEKGSGKPVPFIIDPDIVKREHATYAWYARHVFNMYSYTFKYADDLIKDDGDRAPELTLRPILPVGWGNQDVYFTQYPSGMLWPMGQSITKGDRMVVFLRGSMFPGDWVTDYEFPWANKTATEAMGIPGRVHKGFFNFSSQIFEEVEKELDLHGIKSITFAGHSLGGAVAQVSAAIMATHFPDLEVHCVTFGSPQVGDCEFTDYVARKVNLRRVAYLGSGQLSIPEEHHFVYGFGDIVTQMPVSCEGIAMLACKGLDFAPDTEKLGSFPYMMGSGNIPIYAHDLKNTEGWLRKENYIFGARKFVDIPEGVMISHICSYQCWAAIATGDPMGLSRCYFPDDHNTAIDPQFLCTVNFKDTLPERWPVFNQPIRQSDLDTAIDIADQIMDSNTRRKLRSSSSSSSPPRQARK